MNPVKYCYAKLHEGITLKMRVNCYELIVALRFTYTVLVISVSKDWLLESSPAYTYFLKGTLFFVWVSFRLKASSTTYRFTTIYFSGELILWVSGIPRL